MKRKGWSFDKAYTVLLISGTYRSIIFIYVTVEKWFSAVHTGYNSTL